MSAPLFVVDAHGNYTQLPRDHPAYKAMPLTDADDDHVQMYHPHHERSQLAMNPLDLIDWKGIGWKHVSEWVLKPMLTGLLFGMGSYASRYLVHYIMTTYTSSWHVPVQHALESQTAGSSVSHTPAAQATELAMIEAPSVAAEALAFAAADTSTAGLVAVSAANGVNEAMHMQQPSGQHSSQK